jgi:hypothetical protein
MHYFAVGDSRWWLLEPAMVRVLTEQKCSSREQDIAYCSSNNVGSHKQPSDYLLGKFVTYDNVGNNTSLLSCFFAYWSFSRMEMIFKLPWVHRGSGIFWVKLKLGRA